MSTRHEVTVSASAERDLQRLPDKTAGEIRRFLNGPLRNDPRKAGTPLSQARSTMWEATGPAWRILYQVDANTLTIRIMVVAQRSESGRRAS
ncbi:MULTISPECIES: type II toxin-antitoxin system RelE family toxin [unclassified Frankia]|uniref:type II toxin-antitoxin system RelE family toxin n=1 Tax=unclassified Frankia TaxID=2632575 RepID=UPI002AD32317|nr:MULTISPECIES: type II toxin-antitoxin system RelE/ParE family toxin [unclassified Frankia]